MESLSSVADLRSYIVLVIWTCIYQDRVKGLRGEGQSRTTHHGGPAALCLSLGLYVESQEASTYLRVLGSKRHRQINTQEKTPVSAKT